MTDVEGNRLVACRACGIRVPRATRRCPACSTRQPAVAVDAAPAGGRGRADAGARRAVHRRRRRRTAVLALLAALTATAVGAVWLLTPPVIPPVPVEQHSAPAATAPAAPAPTPAPAPPAAASASRSRGRTDWLFFFKPGDWVMRMADDGLLGLVVRTEKTHRFADGSLGPAYVIQTMEGEERVVDADELERSARLR